MHDKHRERLRKKLEEGGELFEEHELLELLLFYALPRVNTNDIAHNLIETFGSLRKVLEADVKLLQEIDGVGESTAVYLKTLGFVLNKSIVTSELPKIFSFEQIREPLKKMFACLNKEVFVAFFLDKQQRILGKKIICDDSSNKVEINVTELTKQVLALKPTFVVICHNHLSGICKPTQDDDNATEKICLLLKLYNVNLVDHLIVTGNDVYSYYYENRIDSIKEKVDKKV